MDISIGKILLLLLIVVLIFGSTKLPKLGEDIGKAVRGFKKGMHHAETETSVPVKAADDKAEGESERTSR